MRILRVTLAGTVVLALLGGLGSVALAQEDAETAKVTPFTGTRLDAVWDTTDAEWWEEDGIGHSRGMRGTETIEWSDPRLPSEMHVGMNFDEYGPGEFQATAVSGTTLLEGPDGYWSGEFTVYCDDRGCHGMNTITGHEAYEGLLAVFRAYDDIEGPEEGEWVYEGLIFEGEMPPRPEPVEPSAE